jgi:hypothetical protein
MYRFAFLTRGKNGRIGGHAVVSLCLLLLCSGIGGLAQGTAATVSSKPPLSISATHLLGFPNTKNNCKGTLSVQDDVLRFQQDGKPITEVKISSVKEVFLGEESEQVGGTPMKIGKAVTPFGGGRVVSLFAHAKYDTLTLEYVDSNGGLHGAIFQLKKGQGQLVRKDLVVRGVYSNSGDVQARNQSTPEALHEK